MALGKTNFILDVFDTLLGILDKNYCRYTFIGGYIRANWIIAVQFNITIKKRAPEWRWGIFAVSFKEGIDTFHILVYHVVKFDCAGAVVSRDIGCSTISIRAGFSEYLWMGHCHFARYKCLLPLTPANSASPYTKLLLEFFCTLLAKLPNFPKVYPLSSRYNDPTMGKWAYHGVSLYSRNRAPEWCRVAPLERKRIASLLILIGYIIHIFWW